MIKFIREATESAQPDWELDVFHRLFNDNTVKLSYSCMPNMDSIFKAHNTKILKKKDEADAKEEKASCPVGNDCLKTNVVYKATVQHENKISNYIGMTENSFKTRYTQHKSSLKHQQK